MRISIVQLDIVLADPAANRNKVAQIVKTLPETDLIVLPEMFSTGFVTEPQGIAESENSETLKFMLRISKEKNCAVTGSIAVGEDEGDGKTVYYNRLYFVRPDGNVTVYNKRHLFTYGGEGKSFTAGRERVVVEWRGTRILLQICYDLRFPVFSRNRMVARIGRPDYDMIIYVASWPESRIDAWNTLLMARAIENQCYTVGVNRVGKDSACKYSGGSVILNPRGKPVAACLDYAEDTATAVIDMDYLSSFRDVFPVLEDAD
ncbi:MAG: nitrilase family protein [Bacteroidales bacterium]|nr:nitrilase family protein [Bacteroidales bacterium]MCI1784885.1 nitrilase family protein [Bacteroidales bacterium]